MLWPMGRPRFVSYHNVCRVVNIEKTFTLIGIKSSIKKQWRTDQQLVQSDWVGAVQRTSSFDHRSQPRQVAACPCICLSVSLPQPTTDSQLLFRSTTYIRTYVHTYIQTYIIIITYKSHFEDPSSPLAKCLFLNRFIVTPKQFGHRLQRKIQI